MINKKQIKQIEKKENIKILFLIESGSRAWGFESKNSDYDIRGVYAQDYLKVSPIKDQINIVQDELDIELWDLKKFLKLMVNSNPSCWEFLSSNIIYLDNPLRDRLKKIFKSNFSKYALKKHYVSMARQNFEKYINNIGDKANLKKYVYVLRSVACVEWINKYDSPPPKHYKEVIDLLPNNVKQFFEKIIEDKKKSESLEGVRNKEVEKYITSFFTLKFDKDKDNFNLKKIDDIFKEYAEYNASS